MSIHRMTDIPDADLQDVIDDFELEGFTVTKFRQANGKWTVEARKGEPAVEDSSTDHDADDGDDGQAGSVLVERPPNDLLKRLAIVYKGENIRHPQLRAVTLAQWLLESGRAKSKLAKLHLNFGGLKWRPEMATFATKISFEAHDGVDNYCKFATIENFINGYWAFLNRSPYSGWEERASDAQAFIKFIGPIYTPTEGYADRVLALVPEATALLSETEETPIVITSSGNTDLGAIVIDPGHGGTQNVAGSSANNAISRSGVKEKKLTLEYALLLQQALVNQSDRANERIKVILTRTTDVNVTGSKRAAMAFENDAKLFLSIHFNGSTTASTRGTETFFRAPQNGNLNLDDDKSFASDVQAAVMSAIMSFDDSANDRGIKPDTQTRIGALGVLNDVRLGNDRRTVMCHAALVEIEFISNPTVDRLLVSGAEAVANRTKIVTSLAKTLRRRMKTMP